MNEKYVNHLKHLLFNDAMITHAMGMNHNAMDRSCVADGFIDHIKSAKFDQIYAETEAKYLKNREEFEVHPYHLEHVPLKDGVPIPSEELEKLSMEDYAALEAADGFDMGEEWVRGGYWKSLEDVDEYVDGHVSEETVIMLMSRKPHVTIADTGISVLSEMRENK